MNYWPPKFLLTSCRRAVGQHVTELKPMPARQEIAELCMQVTIGQALSRHRKPRRRATAPMHAGTRRLEKNHTALLRLSH